MICQSPLGLCCKVGQELHRYIEDIQSANTAKSFIGCDVRWQLGLILQEDFQRLLCDDFLMYPLLELKKGIVFL